MSYIQHVSPRGAGLFGKPCPCGIPAVTPVQDKLLQLFDDWYGDKAYRQHEEVVQWSDTLSQMIIDNVMQTAQFRAIMKDQEEEQHGEHLLPPGTLRDDADR